MLRTKVNDPSSVTGGSESLTVIFGWNLVILYARSPIIVLVVLTKCRIACSTFPVCLGSLISGAGSDAPLTIGTILGAFLIDNIGPKYSLVRLLLTSSECRLKWSGISDWWSCFTIYCWFPHERALQTVRKQNSKQNKKKHFDEAGFIRLTKHIAGFVVRTFSYYHPFQLRLKKTRFVQGALRTFPSLRRSRYDKFSYNLTRFS